jgi:hypothetical protein
MTLVAWSGSAESLKPSQGRPVSAVASLRSRNDISPGRRRIEISGRSAFLNRNIGRYTFVLPD